MPALVHAILFDDVDWQRVRQVEDLAPLEPVLRKLLVKDRNQRYASADDLISDLKSLTTRNPKHNSHRACRTTCIAVLRLPTLIAKRNTEYFSDGLTDELINALAQFDGLRVVSRSSAFAFKGQSVSIKTIGEQLKVPTILEGSVRSVGNRFARDGPAHQCG